MLIKESSFPPPNKSKRLLFIGILNEPVGPKYPKPVPFAGSFFNACDILLSCFSGTFFDLLTSFFDLFTFEFKFEFEFEFEFDIGFLIFFESKYLDKPSCSLRCCSSLFGVNTDFWTFVLFCDFILLFLELDDGFFTFPTAPSFLLFVDDEDEEGTYGCRGLSRLKTGSNF